FSGGVGRRGFAEPVADEQVATQADAFPAEKKQEEIVREDQRGHRENKEGNGREETRVAGVALHVTHRENGDQRADKGDNEGHHGREWMGAQAGGCLEKVGLAGLADLEPGEVGRLGRRLGRLADVEKDKEGNYEGGRDRRDAGKMALLAEKARAEKAD